MVGADVTEMDLLEGAERLFCMPLDSIMICTLNVSV